jgi:gluconolactonase
MQPQSVQTQDGSIVRNDNAIDRIVPSGAKIEKLADGFQFTEGPIYMPAGHLLFSDIPANTIFRWTHDGKVTEFRKPSGYDGNEAPAGAFVGSNGLTLDKEGRLILCEHGNRRVTRLENDGRVTVLADRYEGKLLNSPNDAVHKSDGSLYFTDPPYGLIKQDSDPKKELPFNGIYRLSAGKLQVLNKDMTRPNGLAFSPDEKYLYVANSDAARKVWLKYPVNSDGTLDNPATFFDVTKERENGLPDGMKVDKSGNIYGTGPGGVWIFSPDGKHLGTIKPPEVPANIHWGPYSPGEKSSDTLYMTARTGLYRIRLTASGIRP